MSDEGGLGTKTEGVKTMLGNPRKAIIKLAIPMIIAMSVQTVYNLADAVWVGGLSNGAAALAAIGLFFPFFFLIMALATGIGVGGSAAIARRIGSKDKVGADNVAEHMVILVIVISIMFTFPMYFLFPDILDLMGAGDFSGLAVDYGRIIIMFSFLIFFNNISNAILRGEGDTKRAMVAMVVGSVLNIFLDPLFIYILDLGLPGAAWATMVSMGATTLLMIYWLFFKKDTFVSFDLKNFKPKWLIIKDIMRVGLPSSLQQMSMSLNMIFLNAVVIFVGGENGVAVFSTGWRVTMMGLLPLMGIATALVSVAGAAFGAGLYNKMKTSFVHALKFGLTIEIPVSLILFVFAGYIVIAFTWSEDASKLRPDLVLFIRMFTLMNFFAGFGMLSSSFFQAIGKGFYSLLVTIFRTLVFAIFFSVLFGIILDLGLMGVWFGILTGNLIGAMISYIWASIYMSRLIKGKIKVDKTYFKSR